MKSAIAVFGMLILVNSAQAAQGNYEKVVQETLKSSSLAEIKKELPDYEFELTNIKIESNVKGVYDVTLAYSVPNSLFLASCRIAVKVTHTKMESFAPDSKAGRHEMFQSVAKLESCSE